MMDGTFLSKLCQVAYRSWLTFQSSCISREKCFHKMARKTKVHSEKFTSRDSHELRYLVNLDRLPNDGCAAEESPFCPANNPPLNRCLTSTAVLTEQLKYRSGSFCKFPPKRLTGGRHERGKKKAADSIFPMSAIVSKPVEKVPSWEKNHFKSIPTSIQKALLTMRMKFYRGDPCSMAFKCTDESKLWYGISHRGSSLPCSFAQKQHQL